MGDYLNMMYFNILMHCQTRDAKISDQLYGALGRGGVGGGLYLTFSVSTDLSLIWAEFLQ